MPHNPEQQIQTTRSSGNSASEEVHERPTCYGCRNRVDLQNDDVKMEVVTNPLGQGKDTIVWHRDCYDQFLEEGEES